MPKKLVTICNWYALSIFPTYIFTLFIPDPRKYIGHLDTLPSMEIIRAAAIGFESGFSGFPGLTITSLNGVIRFLLNGASISWPSADALCIGGKKGKK